MNKSLRLFHQPTLMPNFLYSFTICLLHYYPRHISSINMPIFRRKNCIHTASGIFALCKRLHSTLVESGRKNIKLRNAEQAKPFYQYKNTKIKLCKNNAAIWYNKICRARQITPTYANIRIIV